MYGHYVGWVFEIESQEADGLVDLVYPRKGYGVEGGVTRGGCCALNVGEVRYIGGGGHCAEGENPQRSRYMRPATDRIQPLQTHRHSIIPGGYVSADVAISWVSRRLG